MYGEKTVRGGGRLKNFDQWTEELSKVVFVQDDEDEKKVLLKPEEVLVDDDFEEE